METKTLSGSDVSNYTPIFVLPCFSKILEILQFVGQITESFENNEYTLGVFTDLPKAFHIVDHSILLKKLELYGVTDRNQGDNSSKSVRTKTSSELVSCGSILGPSLFLLYLTTLKMLQIYWIQ